MTTGYRFEELRNVPSYFEGNLDVALGSGVDLNVSPSYTVKGGLWGCVVRKKEGFPKGVSGTMF